ncbi:MAG: hypothetical protein P8166_10070 [Candidatus Thiodiazotropha sp.]
MRQKIFIMLLSLFGQLCSAQTILVSSDMASERQHSENAGNLGNAVQLSETLSDKCGGRLERISIEKIGFDELIGFPGRTGSWVKVADDCGATKTVELIQEYERLHPELVREKIGWVRLTIAKVFLYGGQRKKALHAFESAIISPEPTLENSEFSAAFHMEIAWNHFVRAYIALTRNDKEKLLEVREQLSKGRKVFGQVPYLQDVDSLINNFDSY